MGDFQKHLVQRLVAGVSSEELPALLDNVTSIHELADWQLLQRHLVGLNNKRYKQILKSSGGFLDEQGSHPLLDALSDIRKNTALNDFVPIKPIYWGLSTQNHNFEILHAPTDQNGTQFDYISMTIPVLNGIEYALVFKCNCTHASVELSESLVLVAHIVWQSIGENPDLHVASRIKLGNRERQVLAWTSQGKTSYEISKILNLSEHTINNYITNAGNKLGTNNRVHTVSRAVALGLI